MSNDERILKRAETIMAFITLTREDDVNIDYSAILTVLSQFALEVNNIDKDNVMQVHSIATNIHKFVNEQLRELTIMSN